MGCRIQIRAFVNVEGKAEVCIGFEGDNTETSILVLKEEAKTSLLHTFAGAQFDGYNKNWEYYTVSGLEEGSVAITVEALSRSANKLLYKLSDYIKVGDYYYNDEEIRVLIHGLRNVQPYFRNGSKNYFIRHLQWHNVNYDTLATMPVEEQHEPIATPNPQYTAWGSW